MRGKIFALIITMIVPVALSTALSSTVQAINMAEIYKAAKAEGKVVIYTAPKPPWYKYALKDFKKRYPGVAVEMITGGGGRISRRFISEEVAGISVADI